MTRHSTDWTELREFRGVALTESFVLSWEVKADALCLDIDLCLAPGHPFYEKPRPKEKACIRVAVLEFPAVAKLVDDTGRDRQSAAETAAALRGGRIANLRLIDDGHYRMEGAFGKVDIHAERPILRLKRLMS